MTWLFLDNGLGSGAVTLQLDLHSRSSASIPLGLPKGVRNDLLPEFSPVPQFLRIDLESCYKEAL